MRPFPLILDAALFAGTVAIAAMQGWDSKDLIWGLWLSSLSLGYASIVMGAVWLVMTDRLKPGRGGETSGPASRIGDAVTSILPNVVALWIALRYLPFDWGKLPAILFLGIGIVAAVTASFPAMNGGRPILRPEGVAFRLLTRWPLIGFFIAFFTIHFGGFHFVHGMFLNEFFTLVPGRGPVFDKGVAAGFLAIVSEAARRYWPFVAASAASFVPAYVTDLRAGKWTFFTPYKNVIKMHLLVFVFAGLFAAKMQNRAVYPVLVLYFFPWGLLPALIRKRRNRPWSSPPPPDS